MSDNEKIIQGISDRLGALEVTVEKMAAKLDERDTQQTRAFKDFATQMRDAQVSLAKETEYHFEQLRVREDALEKQIIEQKTLSDVRTARLNERIDKLDGMPEQLNHIAARLFGKVDEPDDDSFLRLQKNQFALLTALQKQSDRTVDLLTSLFPRVERLEAQITTNEMTLKRLAGYETFIKGILPVVYKWVMNKWVIWFAAALTTFIALILSKGT